MQKLRLVEFRVRRTGEVLLATPLFDFLKMLHCQSPAGDEYHFEELQIMLDGEELAPSPSQCDA